MAGIISAQANIAQSNIEKTNIDQANFDKTMFCKADYSPTQNLVMKHYDIETFSSKTSLGYLLKINHALMHDGADRIFAPHDISFVQWIALKKLRDGSALTASDLCREIRHDNGAFTRLLDQLEERGYLSRQRSKQDRRVVDLQITEAGLAKVKELTPLVVNNLNAILDPFSAEEFSQLTGLLNKLKTRLEEYTAEKTSDTPS